MPGARRKRPLRRLPQGDCPLTADQVYSVVARHATPAPLATREIAEWCDLLPDMTGVTTDGVHKLLLWLQGRDRVTSFSGQHDRDTLIAQGVPTPASNARYWALPTTET